MAGFTCTHVAEETFNVDTSGHVPFGVYAIPVVRLTWFVYLNMFTRFEHHKTKNTTFIAIIIHKTLSVTKLSLDVYLVPLHIPVQLRNLSQQ